MPGTATATRKPTYEAFLPRVLRAPEPERERQRQTRGFWAEFIDNLPVGEPVKIKAIRGHSPESFRPSIYAAAQKLGTRVGVRKFGNDMYVVKLKPEDVKALQKARTKTASTAQAA